MTHVTNARQFLFSACLVTGNVCAAQAQMVPVPAGCDPIASVQRQNCAVTAFFKCGPDWQVVDYAGGAPHSVVRNTGDWGGVSFSAANGNYDIALDPNSGPLFSISAMLHDGRSNFARKAQFTINGETGDWTDITGYSEFRGNEIDVSGYTLRNVIGQSMTMFEAGVSEAVVKRHAFWSDDLQILIPGGFEQLIYDGAPNIEIGTPREIHVPGDTGFLKAEAKYGCDGSN